MSRESDGELGDVPALGSRCSQEHGQMTGLPFMCLHAELAPMSALPRAVLRVYGAFFFCKGF